MIIGIAGAITPTKDGLKDGDGFVAVDEIGLPGVTVVVLQGVDLMATADLLEIGYPRRCQRSTDFPANLTGATAPRQNDE